MKKTWVAIGALSVSVGLAGCCIPSGQPESTPAPVAAPAPPPPPPPTGVAYAVAPGLPEWSSSYAASYLHDGTNTSYWCTAMNPTFPMGATLTLAPTVLTGVDFDTRLRSYETSAVRVVTIEALGPTGQPLQTHTVELNQNAISSFTFPSPVATGQVRVTFHSNFGGPYAGLAELALRTGPPTGVPVRPAVAPNAPPPVAPVQGLPYVAASLPVWNESYSVAKMQDNDPSTYWCTPMGPTFPFTGTFTLSAPGTVSQVLFDNRVPGYETSGIQGVTVHVYAPSGQVVTTATAELPRNAATIVPLPSPTLASRLDIVFRSNHGGGYAGLAELQIR